MHSGVPMEQGAVASGIPRRHVTAAAPRPFLAIQETRAPTADVVDCDGVLDTALFLLRRPMVETGTILTVGPLPLVRGSRAHLVDMFRRLISIAIRRSTNGSPRIEVEAERHGSDWAIELRWEGAPSVRTSAVRVTLPAAPPRLRAMSA